MTSIEELVERIERIEAALTGDPDYAPVEMPDRSVAAMIRWVAFETGLRGDAIRGNDRRAAHARARFAVFWGARELRELSFAKIGRAVGDRDHSTVVSGYRRALEMRERDPAFRLLTNRMIDAFSVRKDAA